MEIFLVSKKTRFASADGKKGNTPADTAIRHTAFDSFEKAISFIEDNGNGIPVNAECKQQVDEDGVSVVTGVWDWNEDLCFYERGMAAIERIKAR